MSDVQKKIAVDKTTQGHWRVTLNNPPIDVSARPRKSVLL